MVFSKNMILGVSIFATGPPQRPLSFFYYTGGLKKIYAQSSKSHKNNLLCLNGERFNISMIHQSTNKHYLVLKLNHHTMKF